MILFLLLATWQLTGQQVTTKPTYKLYNVDFKVSGQDTVNIDPIQGITFGWWSMFVRGYASDSVDLAVQYACSPIDSFWDLNTWTNVVSLSDTTFKPNQLYPITLVLLKARVIGGVSNKESSTGSRLRAYLCVWEL